MAIVQIVGDANTAGGRILGSVQGMVFINGRLVSVDGSPVSGHGRGIHSNPVTSSGSHKVFINNIPVNRQGDPDTCGHVRATASTNIHIS